MATPSALALLLQRYGSSLPMSPQALSQLPQLPQAIAQLPPQKVMAPSINPDQDTGITGNMPPPGQMAAPPFTPGPQSVLGGLFQYDPSKDMGSEANGGNRWGILGATLKDVGAELDRRPEDANNLYQQQEQLKAFQQKVARQAAVKRFGDAKTPQEREQALMDAYLNGGDPGAMSAIAKSQKPDWKTVAPGETLQGFDQYSGLPIGDPIKGTPKPENPLTNGGMESFDHGKTWAPIPGYLENATALATGKRAPPKPAATGAVIIPHPSRMY